MAMLEHQPSSQQSNDESAKRERSVEAETNDGRNLSVCWLSHVRKGHSGAGDSTAGRTEAVVQVHGDLERAEKLGGVRGTGLNYEGSEEEDHHPADLHTLGLCLNWSLP